MPKKILFSPHPAFLEMIKSNFSDPEKYQIIGMQDHFIKALNDIDVSNVTPFSGDESLRQNSLLECVRILNAPKIIPSELLDAKNDIFDNFAETKLDSVLFASLYDLVAMLFVLDKTRPDMIVLHNDVEPYMRALALWANANNIPCLHVPHSVIIDSSERSEIGSDIHDIITASHIAVSGSYQRNWYESRGMASDKIFETGLPQFDKIVKLQYDKNRARRLIKVDKNKPVILYASSWRQDTNLLGCHDGVSETYKNFLIACKKLDITPIVKLHPNSGKSSVDWHVMIAKNLNVNAIIMLQHLPMALQASDIVFSYGPSNILLEASLYPIHLATTHGYDNDDVVIKIGEDASSEKIIENMLQLFNKTSASDPSEFRIKYMGKTDGVAHKRIANVIKLLLGM